MKRILLLIVFAGGLLALAPAPVIVGQDTTEQRLDRLERRLDDLIRQLGLPANNQQGRGTPPPIVLPPPPPPSQSIHLQFGNPGGPGVLLDKEFFVISHRNDLKLPDWVAYHLTKENIQGNAPRVDNFRADPELPEGKRSELTDYKNSGFDRGHLAPAASFHRSKIAMSTTFLLSNMAPETPNLNRKIWADLEDGERKLAAAHGSIWIFTGTLFLDSQLKPTTPQKFIGEHVAVPTHVYKVILCQHSPTTFEMFAFRMPNQKAVLPGTPKNYLVTVDDIEAESKLDFFAYLPDEIESKLEAQKATLWPVQ